jgi:hypothetical protein
MRHIAGDVPRRHLLRDEQSGFEVLIRDWRTKSTSTGSEEIGSRNWINPSSFGFGP